MPRAMYDHAGTQISNSTIHTPEGMVAERFLAETFSFFANLPEAHESDGERECDDVHLPEPAGTCEDINYAAYLVLIFQDCMRRCEAEGVTIGADDPPSVDGGSPTLYDVMASCVTRADTDIVRDAPCEKPSRSTVHRKHPPYATASFGKTWRIGLRSAPLLMRAYTSLEFLGPASIEPGALHAMMTANLQCYIGMSDPACILAHTLFDANAFSSAGGVGATRKGAVESEHRSKRRRVEVNRIADGQPPRAHPITGAVAHDGALLRAYGAWASRLANELLQDTDSGMFLDPEASKQTLGMLRHCGIISVPASPWLGHSPPVSAETSGTRPPIPVPAHMLDELSDMNQDYRKRAGAFCAENPQPSAKLARSFSYVARNDMLVGLRAAFEQVRSCAPPSEEANTASFVFVLSVSAHAGSVRMQMALFRMLADVHPAMFARVCRALMEHRFGVSECIADRLEEAVFRCVGAGQRVCMRAFAATIVRDVSESMNPQTFSSEDADTVMKHMWFPRSVSFAVDREVEDTNDVTSAGIVFKMPFVRSDLANGLRHYVCVTRCMGSGFCLNLTDHPSDSWRMPGAKRPNLLHSFESWLWKSVVAQSINSSLGMYGMSVQAYHVNPRSVEAQGMRLETPKRPNEGNDRRHDGHIMGAVSSPREGMHGLYRYTLEDTARLCGTAACDIYSFSKYDTYTEPGA